MKGLLPRVFKTRVIGRYTNPPFVFNIISDKIDSNKLAGLTKNLYSSMIYLMDLNWLLVNFKEVNLNTILVIAHVIGVALGVGGASLSDLLFFKSIKDKVISKDEFESLMTASKIIWAGLIVLILSGLTIFLLIYLERGSIPMLASPKWQAKLSWVGIIFANGIFFKTMIFPKIKKLIGQKLSLENTQSVLWYFAFSGFISIFSWYSVTIISLLPRSFRPPYFLLMGVYALILVLGIVISRFILKKKIG